MIKIKIDNRIAFKGELGEWKERPPDEFSEAIKPGGRPQPHMKAVLIAMADAVMSQQDVSITVLTKLKGIHSGWSMQVVLT